MRRAVPVRARLRARRRCRQSRRHTPSPTAWWAGRVGRRGPSRAARSGPSAMPQGEARYGQDRRTAAAPGPGPAVKSTIGHRRGCRGVDWPPRAGLMSRACSMAPTSSGSEIQLNHCRPLPSRPPIPSRKRGAGAPAPRRGPTAPPPSAAGRPGCRRGSRAWWHPPRLRHNSARNPRPGAAVLGQLLVAPVPVDSRRPRRSRGRPGGGLSPASVRARSVVDCTRLDTISWRRAADHRLSPMPAPARCTTASAPFQGAGVDRTRWRGPTAPRPPRGGDGPGGSPRPRGPAGRLMTAWPMSPLEPETATRMPTLHSGGLAPATSGHHRSQGRPAVRLRAVEQSGNRGARLRLWSHWSGAGPGAVGGTRRRHRGRAHRPVRRSSSSSRPPSGW